MNVFVTGGTGTVGRRLCLDLKRRHHQVTVLTRNVRRARKILGDDVNLVQGDLTIPSMWIKQLEGYDAVINLAGENIFERRWSERQKDRIEKSRVSGTIMLVKAICSAGNQPTVLISTSAVGYYGRDVRLPCNESSRAGNDFIARLCIAWENAALGAGEAGARVVVLRFGMVLTDSGGILGRLIPLFKMGGGAIIGDGAQWLSWIHIDDLVAMIFRALEDNELHGVFNAVAPHPVTNRVFSEVLARTLRRPLLLKVPKLALRGLYGEGGEVIAGGQNVLPARFEEVGFQFRYTELSSALSDLVN